MKRLLAAAVLAGLLPASTAVHAQAGCAASAPGRFEDHGDGTVTDRQAGLMWLRCSAGQAWTGRVCQGDSVPHAWPGLAGVADAVNRRGDYFFNDWRVPQVRELAGLAERGCPSASPRLSLATAVFPAAPTALYWTATARAGQGVDQQAYAYGVDGVQVRRKDEAHLVRLVRSAP